MRSLTKEQSADTSVIVIGAGACGLMTARELSKTGVRVTVLEARDRVGGRIFPLSEKSFGCPAEGGAEFLHGDAPITKALLKEAGLTFIPVEGKIWSAGNDESMQYTGDPMEKPDIEPFQEELNKRLNSLKKDLPIAEFLRRYFGKKRHARLRQWIIRMTKGFNVADPRKASTFALRDEWLDGTDQKQGRVLQGYGALTDFLAKECAKNGTEILPGAHVTSIHHGKDGVRVRCKNGKIYKAQKAIITLPIPLLLRMRFHPPLPHVKKAAQQIGFGSVMKIVLRFKTSWWEDARSELDKTSFIFTEEDIPTWWTRFPEKQPVLTGWAGGSESAKFKRMSPSRIVHAALGMLSNAFGIDKRVLEKQLVASAAINWILDPFARGAYSYSTPQTEKAVKTLVKPVGNRLYFAGEALYEGEDFATVEAALGSGRNTAAKLLNTR